ncbi:hypothetical protein LTR84_000394 [Exophiala bonariae]|uniref:ABC transporter domain-containing protein n=1 Tax=Exophiala bonariae TaxID=1690606 RepID=A0AAV9NRJ1_9EURO|nr:hypothetical protein LTR84_000394 [Exophiala bonariae]
MPSSLANAYLNEPHDSALPGAPIDPSSAQVSDTEKTCAVSTPEAKRQHSLVHERLSEHNFNDTDTVADPDDVFLTTDPVSPFNPDSENFNARTWAKAVAKIAAGNGQDFRRIGLCFQNLSVFGYGTSDDFQKDVANVWLALPNMVCRMFSAKANTSRIDILRSFDGIIQPGEMCVVLGPPGSGCSTFLKAIAGETNGIYVNQTSYFNYHGILAEELHSSHRGDAIYTAEVDVHFPSLSVGETLTFASRARSQRVLPHGITRRQYCDRFRDAIMAMYGISHTIGSKVGDDFVRGVSGGERKRVTIAEATLSGAPFQCWDNSTRGLDSANAIEFCKTLRLQSEFFRQTCVVSMYQAPQSAYDLFDKALLIYEGRQIYFGPASRAKEYFINLGFDCAPRQTTPDFLTSMTFPAERSARTGCRPPQTPDEFAAAWNSSPEYRSLQVEIEAYKEQHPIGGQDANTYRELKRSHQAEGQRLKSPYTLTYMQQVQLCAWRGYRRLKADPTLTLTMSIGNVIMALIISSLFFDLDPDTDSFYDRSVVIFVAILFNAFSSMLELLTLYAHRPIIEKQSRYTFYHPSAEAYASVLVDLPVKIANTLSFNSVFYFMTNLNRSPGPFFFYLLVVFCLVLAMSGFFRSVGAISRSEQQAMIPATLLMLALLIFTGFIVPIDYMLGWCRWIRYVDPVAWGYESLMVNEFHGRVFLCSTYVPDYANIADTTTACGALGAVPGQLYVDGDDFIKSAYSYEHAHKWRNVGIIVAIAVLTHLFYFIASEYVTAKKSKGEVLVFRRGVLIPAAMQKDDVEKSLQRSRPPMTTFTQPDTVPIRTKNDKQHLGSIFHWRNVCYDIKIKGKPRRILESVDGWVKPGTLTALMGVSGAGKTTLLDCLADRRVGVGILTGKMFVDGGVRDESFQRNTGYAQQQDLHLQTSTVREALQFSALLRQPASTSKEDKLAYVEKVMDLLDMFNFADAIVGVLGEGLNVEQRKRLTIGVELAAKPPLLLFVDEPTSGLDSQTSWAILDLLQKLSDAGQAILCTIHQPSAVLFQRFDRLLLLAEGGRTVYFGEIGENSNLLTGYFERNGAAPCPPGANPAEWMLEAIGAAPGSHSEVDWYQTWRDSPEYQTVQGELARLESPKCDQPSPKTITDVSRYQEFAAPLWQQFSIVTVRAFQNLYRTPSYIYSKLLLCAGTSLFIGLVFLDAPLTKQGLQNQMFAAFEICSILSTVVNQQIPYFVEQRSLYEVRERPAKTYSWKIFMLSQILSELPYTLFASIIMWALVYYPVGFSRNAEIAGQAVERGALMWLLFWQLLLFASTFAHLCISWNSNAEAGGNAANFLFILVFFFCGVLSPPDAMPRFWIFLYRVSPIGYWVSTVLSTGLANVDVQCASNEWTAVTPPQGSTCGDYMADYIAQVGGYVMDPGSTSTCSYCAIKDTNVFLASISAHYEDRWRNFGILWAFILFNIFGAIVLYWIARVPKGKKKIL